VTVLTGVVFGSVFFAAVLAAGLGWGLAVALFTGAFLAGALRAGVFLAGALVAVLLLCVCLRVLVAMSGLRPGMGLGGAPLLLMGGEEGEGGEADGECDAVGPGHPRPA
jgi:hypothetical protein